MSIAYASGRPATAEASIDERHDLVLGLFEPDQMYEAHVNLIQHGRNVCHAQRPDHDACPLRLRCRFVYPKAR
jgi:endonuclease-3